MLDSPDKFTSRLKTRIHVLDVGPEQFELLSPLNPDALLDDPGTQERYRTDDYLPYWPIIWPSGLMLAERILRDPASPPALPAIEVGGALPRAIELGCGLGATGIAAAKRGWHVTFTDYDPEAVEFAAYNARRNGVPPERIRAVHMDWRRPLVERFRWVIASDVLYERRLHKLIVGAIEALLASDGVAWVSDPQRTAATDFPLEAVQAGLRITTVNLEGKNFAGGLQSGTLYVLSRPPHSQPNV